MTRRTHPNTRPVWNDEGHNKRKRPQAIGVSAPAQGLTPIWTSREGLGVKPTRPCCASASQRATSTGLIPNLPNVIDAANLADAVPLERAYSAAAHEAIADLAEIVCRGYLHPLGSDEPIHIERALRKAFAEHGLRLFQTPPPPRRVPLTEAQKNAVVQRDGRRCGWCGTTDEVLVIDHIHPVRWGGTNDLGNLQVLCSSCNGWKSDRVAVDG